MVELRKDRRAAKYIESVYPVLSEWLFDYRITQRLLSKLMFLHVDPLRDRLRGYTSFTLEEAQRLEQLTGIPINMLFRRENNVK